MGRVKETKKEKGKVMSISPTLSKTMKHALYGINPHLEAKWNARLERWEIWFNDKIREPYIIVVTKNHFDRRILDEVRHSFWFSQHIKQNSIEMQNKAEYAKIKRDEYNHDNFLEVSKEAEPLLKSLADAGTSSHGRSKTMFQGIGTGKP